METKVFYTKDKKLIENEDVKRRGFEIISPKALGEDKEGYYVIIKGDEEFFKLDVFKEVEEIKEEEKEKILEEWEKMNESANMGMGNIFG